MKVGPRCVPIDYEATAIPGFSGAIFTDSSNIFIAPAAIIAATRIDDGHLVLRNS